MKNTFKLLGIIAFVAVIGFLMAACDDDGGGSGGGGGGTSSLSIEGVWKHQGNFREITVSGSTGVIKYLGNENNVSLYLDAEKKGYIKVGTPFWQNLTRTGNLTWSGQQIGVTNVDGEPTVAAGTRLFDVTFTMSASGQTLTVDGGFGIYSRWQ